MRAINNGKVLRHEILSGLYHKSDGNVSYNISIVVYSLVQKEQHWPTRNSRSYGIDDRAATFRPAGLRLIPKCFYLLRYKAVAKE